MALKSINTKLKQLEKAGDKAEGYLVGVGSMTFKAKKPGDADSIVPKLTLQDKKGQKFSVLLGAAAKDDVENMELHAFTVITKGAQRKTRSGNFVNEWDIAQDSEDVLRAEA